ncbi:MAG: molybdopterin-dependent oxidoreductase, partial [Chloroflexi bacterium]|nr:molybdopterin-dependent oxidoreductase [Chloroflexota bacterium]
WQGATDADFSSAYVRVNEDGSATVYTGISDMGQGIYTALAQVAAEELGILPENVGVVGGDTETTPMCLGAWGSRGAPIAGSAVKIAAADAKQRLFAVAAAKLEAAVEDLESEGGKIYVKGSLERALSVGEVAGAAHFTTTDGAAGSILGRGFWDAPTEVLGEKGGHYAPAYAFAAAAAEVEVDPETGQVRLLSFTSAHDVAQAINPMIVEGQIQGGAAQGIGYGLFEEMVYDQESGRLLNPSFVDYKVPTAMDLPRIVPVIVEPGPDPAVPAGVKGVGEAGYICAAGAIANAVSDAVGVRISELPITSERIYNALVGKQQ